jgi:glycopeptide antibiotics resistance protein
MLRFAGLLVLIILYGSLFPFDFRAAGGPLVAIDHLLLHAWTPESLSFANVVSNVLLYVPLGFALTCATVSRVGRGRALVLATALGALLSVSVELAQHFLPSRVTDLPDVITNTTGTVLGGVVGALSWHRGQSLRGGSLRVADPIAFMLAGTWIVGLLWPFAPTLDVDHVKNALEPLLLHFNVVPIEVLRHGTGWLAFAVLLQAAIPGRLSRTFALTAMLIGPFAGLALLGGTINPSSVLGAWLAVVAWLAVSRRSTTAIACVLAILLTATMLGVGLAPHAFAETSRSFDWIPFRDYVDSSILGASSAFLGKVFLFGSAVWAIARTGLGVPLAGAMVAILLLAIAWAQMHLPGQPPGITDAMIALCATLAMQFVRAPARGAVHDTGLISSGENTVSGTSPAATADS